MGRQGALRRRYVLIYQYNVNESFATVGSQEDVDGCCPLVILTHNRNSDDPIQLLMSPRVARMVARRLNRAAKLISSK